MTWTRSALSSVEKPILTPEQVAGHQVMWAEDNLKDYPYLLINPITPHMSHALWQLLGHVETTLETLPFPVADPDALVRDSISLAVQVNGARVLTIEGLENADGSLHPMQQAFGRHHALQCGFCTPGMVMRGVAMAAEGVPAEAQAVSQALCGNLCRCTGYRGIVNAVCEGLQHMRARSTGGAAA